MELKSKQNEKMPMDDAKIVELYFRRDEKAIEETDFKYKNYQFSIAYNLVHGKRDCEECLNDTYLAAWNAMPPSRPNVLKAFLTTIVRRIAINRYHSNLRHSEMQASLDELNGILADDTRVEEEVNAKELGLTLSRCLRSLPARRRFLFLSRYYIAQPIDTIAKAVGLSRSMVNKELAAIRKALKEQLESEGYTL